MSKDNGKDINDDIPNVDPNYMKINDGKKKIGDNNHSSSSEDSEDINNKRNTEKGKKGNNDREDSEVSEDGKKKPVSINNETLIRPNSPTNIRKDSSDEEEDVEED